MSLETFVYRLIDNPRRIAYVRIILQVFCGVLLLGFGYVSDHARLLALLSGAQATGKVVDSEKVTFTDSGGSSSHDNYMPIVEFDAGSRMVRFEDTWGGRGPLPRGLTVPVIYDAANPNNALIDHGARNWLPWMPFMAVGAFLLIVALRSWLALAESKRYEQV